MDVRFKGFQDTITDAVNEGVRRGYLHPDNIWCASILVDPHFELKNTKDNTPAVIHMELVQGNIIDVQIAAKGGGSENKTKFIILNPSDSLVDWVMKTVPNMGAGWCPPGMLVIGIGGTAERAMLMAKQVLIEDINMYDLLKRGPQNKTEELRIELFQKVNALGIGAQRPEVDWMPDVEKSTPINLDKLIKAEFASWKPRQTSLLNVKILTGRDVAHKRTQEMLGKGEKLPVDFTNRVI